MIYPGDFESKIGFDTVRELLTGYCECAEGKLKVHEMSFSEEEREVCSRLGAVKELVQVLEGKRDFPFGTVDDFKPWLSEIRAQGSYLSGDRLSRIGKAIGIGEELARFFSVGSDAESEGAPRLPILEQLFSDLHLYPDVKREIERCINRFGEVKDSASPRLAEIRRSISAASGSMSRAMRRVMESAVSEGIIDRDVAPSMRDGRMVIPVAAMMKRRINGIVHDESATGKTVYIEPAEVVEAGNRMRELEMERHREEVAVLTGVTDYIRPYVDGLKIFAEELGLLDFIRAKARFALDVGGQMPTIEKKPEIEWYHAVHPGLLVALRSQGRSVTPLDIKLTKDQRILIISGPNAGGKSICLKTVAIVQYMAQCGVLPTLYSNSHMGIFKNLFIDIGDEQSLENDLSTYSSHLRNMKYFLNHSNGSTLLLADEMGSGTEPQIGGALAQAILKRLGEAGCYGVVTTHYQNLKTFADVEPGFVNGAMLYDREHLRPTFQLSIGSPGSSFALEIARKTGLPSDVVELAKEIVGSDYVNMDKYMLDIARDRRYWANKRKSIREKEQHLDSLLETYEATAEEIRLQRKEILKKAKEDAKEIMSSANAVVERAVHEIRKTEAEKEATKKVRKELSDFKQSLENEDDNGDVVKSLKHKSKKSRLPKSDIIASEPKKSLGVGDYVKIKDGGSSTGQILSVSGKKAEVAFGSLRTIVSLDKLVGVSKPKADSKSQVTVVSSSTTEESRKRQLNFRNEIDVRGMRADEALQAVTYFIDDALQFNASRVRILHGTGHGILKTVIRQWLKSNPGVVNAEDEDIRFGGAGITVVDLEA